MRILILEEDPIDLERIQDALREGHVEDHLIAVSNHQDFLDQLNTAKPNLILASTISSDLDEDWALAVRNQNCRDIPFILISNTWDEAAEIAAFAKGATDYVLKQRLGRLVPSVQRALREQQTDQECQQLAQALRVAEDLLHAIVEAAPIGIITMTHDRQVTTWNTAAEALYGYTANQAVAHPLQLVVEEQQALFNHCFEQVVQNHTIFNREFRYRRQNGELLDVSVSLAPLHDAYNRVYGVVMMTSDIAFRKQIETQRLHLVEQENLVRAAAESANRIKEEFLAILSHELRTPLNSIVGWINLIQKGNLTPDIFQRALDTIERNAMAQTQLIEDLLDLSSIVRGQVSLKLQPVSVSQLLKTTAATLRPTAQSKAIQLDLDIDGDVGVCQADFNRLQQICWNLLSNAIKFTSKGGSVQVRAFDVDDFLHIQFIDSGIGIAPDFLPYVFDHFRQADGSSTRSHGGLGLGLAICRRLVELHGGTIQVESPGIDRGAVFTVILPHANAQLPSLDHSDGQAAQSTCEPASAVRNSVGHKAMFESSLQQRTKR